MPRRNKRSVLIVDDDDDVRTLLASIVRHRMPSVDVRTAHDGLEALELVATEIPDLLVFDLDMPHLDGIGLATQIIAMPKTRQPALCAISCHASRHRERLLELGVTRVIDKTGPLTILSAIESLITASDR